LISPFATACSVYPPPGGTLGSSRVRVIAEVATLLAIPSALWKEAWSSSMVKEGGSVALAVHVRTV